MSPSRTTEAVTFQNGKNKSEITCYFWFSSNTASLSLTIPTRTAASRTANPTFDSGWPLHSEHYSPSMNTLETSSVNIGLAKVIFPWKTRQLYAGGADCGVRAC